MRLIYSIAWNGSRLLGATFFRWQVNHPERVPMDGPLIVASNHASYIDPPLIGGASPRILNYLGRESLFRNRAFAWVLAQLNSIPVDRDGASPRGLKVVLDRLAAGNAVLLFPEGTRTSDGRIQPVRAGLGLMVVKSGAPVLPVRVFGTFEALGRKSLVPKPCKLVVSFGEPMRFEEERAAVVGADKARTREIYQQISEKVMARIASLPPYRTCSRFP